MAGPQHDLWSEWWNTAPRDLRIRWDGLRTQQKLRLGICYQPCLQLTGLKNVIGPESEPLSYTGFREIRVIWNVVVS